MSLLRMQNRTPPIYCEESRDFQLFCRLYDAVINGMLFDSSTITELLDTQLTRSSFLQLLQTKLGFFTLHSFDDTTLRHALSGFPTMVKYKGAKQSIIYAVNTFLKINKILSPVTVTYQKTPLTLYNGYTVPDHTIVVGISASLQEGSILEEIFRYILPVGTAYYFYYYSTVSDLVTVLEADNAEIILISDNINSTLRSYAQYTNTEVEWDFDFMDSFQNDTNEKKRLINAVDTVNMITDYFTQTVGQNTSSTPGDIIPTDDENNSYLPGNDLLFLGIHYSDESFSDYMNTYFSSITPENGKSVIVFNESEYLYLDDSWYKLNILPSVTSLFDVQSPQEFDVVGVTDSSNVTRYRMYYDDSWIFFGYPLYMLEQRSSDNQFESSEEGD